MKKTKKPARAVVVLLLLPAPLLAHRLDEYLQATRLSLAADRIVLKTELTPGVAVAATVFASIDANRDGSISAAEGTAYANRVLEETTLEVDGTRRPLDLISNEFPSFRQMSAGIGVIRIELRAPWPGARGRHSLLFRNDHDPAIGAYLVNALVPESRAVEITGQHRDPLQREILLSFDIR